MKKLELNERERSMPLDVMAIGDDNENPKLRISLTSEYPVREYDHYEILDHSISSIDLSRALAGASFRDGHYGLSLGKIDNPSVNNKKVYVDVTFSRHNPDAMRTYNEMKDNIRPNVSARVLMNDFDKLTPESYKDGIPVYRSKNWTLVHGATVEDPADYTVGVNRELTLINKQRGNGMEEEVKNPAAPKQEDRMLSDAELATMRANIEKELGEKNKGMVERAFKEGGEKAALNIAGILKFKNDFKDKVRGIDLETKAQEFIQLGARESEFAAMITRNLCEQHATPDNNIGLNEREAKQFSFKKLILSQDPKANVKADFEMEVCRSAAEAASKSGVTPNGLCIPTDVLLRPRGRSRALTSPATSTGASQLIASQFYPENFIELVRNKTVSDKVGVMTMGGLVGNVVIPKQSGAAIFSWQTDGSVGSTESDQTFGQLTLSPKLGTANTQFSRQTLFQTTPSIDTLIENDLAKVAAIGKDLAVFHGTGANGQPTGIAGTTGVGSSATGKSPIAFPDLVAMETDIANANLDVDTMFYAMNPTLYGALKTRPEIGTTFPQFILRNKEINGYGVVRSKQISSGAAFFGDFSQVVVGEWNGLDIVVDPYTYSQTGLIQVTVFIYCDVGVRYAGAFSYGASLT